MSKQLLLAVGVGVLLSLITAMSYATKRWVGSSSDYILAGREVSSSLLATGVLAFGFATDISVLFGVFGLTAGYFTSVSLGIVYVAWIVYGLVLVRFVRNVGTSTITEWYEMRFDYATRAAIAVTQLLGLVFIISAGSLGAASILKGFAGWPIMPMVAGILGVAMVIVLLGGLWGVTVSNVVLTLYGLVVFPLVLGYLFVNVGDVGWLLANVPEGAVGFAFPGGWNFTTFGGSSYLTWTVLWFVALVYGATYYWTRAGSARSDRVARNGFVTAGILALFLMTLVMPLLAMYSLALAPDAFTVTGGEVPPAGAYGVLASTLPAAIGVLIPIGFLAASISTYTTDVIAAAAIGLRDFYQRFFAPEADPEELLLPSRLISLSVVVAAFALAMTYNVRALVELFLTTLGISSVIVLVDIRWKVMTARSAALGAVVGTLTVFGWTIAGLDATTGVHVVWPALGSTLAVGILGGLLTESKYYARDGWSIEPTVAEVEAADDIDLTDDHVAVLESIATGGTRFADFIDTLQVASHQVNDVVEDLDRHRYVHRRGGNSHEFYEFDLTEKGREALEDAGVGPDDPTLRKHDLTEEMADVLAVVDENPGVIIDDVADELGQTTPDVVPLVQRLLELGYISGFGQIRQKLETTDEGATIAAELSADAGRATDEDEAVAPKA
ncbi:sodium:solute symporter family transporter [Halorussus lipolyticus]|uniref:sodium:solute symporter family transporter n=1 Tax=Halorussus lipolyticus TaxID=3034024 RepID=UPI0023E8267D|nr:hypothetical protein [Halorussus sp. DT80]